MCRAPSLTSGPTRRPLPPTMLLLLDLGLTRLRLRRCLAAWLSNTGNRLSSGKQGGAIRFGGIDQLDGDDRSWGDWSSEPVPCGVPPTEWGDGYGHSDTANAGWGPGAPTGTADGRLDGDGVPQAAGYGTGGCKRGGPSYSAPGRLRWKAQPARWASAAFRRSPNGNVRVTDAQRANVVPERWVATDPLAGAAASRTGDGVRIVFDRSLPPPPPPLAEVKPGLEGLPAPREITLGVSPIPTYFPGHPGGKVVKRLRLPQSQPPYFHTSKWVVPEGGWSDTGDPLIHLSFGREPPEVVFGPTWGLGWVLPPGGWGLDRLLMHNLLWEHLVASALTPMGQGGLAKYTDNSRADAGAND